MGSQNKEKLNWLNRSLPEGLVVDARWLERHGISRQLRRKYVMNGWLLSLARGVYRRPVPSDPNGPLLWQQLVVSLNALIGLPVAVGARTALEVQGLAHYLAVSGPREVHLYTQGDPPRWVPRLGIETQVVFHSSLKLFRGAQIPPYGGKAGSASMTQSSLTLQPSGLQSLPLVVSTPERAILELLDEVPSRETFHQADVLMEGLRTLSPRRLQALLADCRSVKIKRLFFWFAERHNHVWLHQLDRSSIDFGKGKRMLVRGGKLDTKYNITVPENLDAVL